MIRAVKKLIQGIVHRNTIEYGRQKFRDLPSFFRWYYRMRPRWIAGFERHILHCEEASREGYKIRMREIARRKKIPLEQRQKEKRNRQEAARKDRERSLSLKAA